ncbi:MAG: GspE/PulE family protein [Pseudomonadota bacterium]
MSIAMLNAAQDFNPAQASARAASPDDAQGVVSEDVVGARLVALLLAAGSVTPSQVKLARRMLDKLEDTVSLLGVLRRMEAVDEAAIRAVVRANPNVVRFGEFLVELGVVSQDDVNTALNMSARQSGKQRLGEILVANRVLSEHRLFELLGDQLGLQVVEPNLDTVDRSLLERVNINWCHDSGVLPVRTDNDGAYVAFADPLDQDVVKLASNMLGRPILPMLAPRTAIRETLGAFRRAVHMPLASRESGSVEALDRIVREALDEGVSDVHIEPLRGRSRIRFRIDGAMVEHEEVEQTLGQALVSRIKVLAGADIAERRRHQGGRIEYKLKDRGCTIDIRASFYVTIHGEKTVLRLLNRPTELLAIDRIGLRSEALERFQCDALDVPTGVVIVTGPTGSGKTTTLYSCVDYLNSPDVSIVTAEDPVEYVIEGISQCSINDKIALTFDETLRHIVRQDPDIIVLGEIRDKFSADTAIQAALTGHKVLTTFHTEDSVGSLLRLMNMDIEPFMISSTVVAVVAQRLLRKVCPDCAEPYAPTPRDCHYLGYSLSDLRHITFKKGRGCPHCRNTGYRGRIGVYEVLVPDEQVKDAILRRRTTHEIRSLSMGSAGLVTLLEEGLLKAADGVTTVPEVIRHLPRVTPPRPLDEVRRLAAQSLAGGDRMP